MSINDAATRYLFGFRQFAFMPVPSETFAGRGRQNTGALFGRPNEAIQPAPDALQVECNSWSYPARRAGYARSARCFAGCDGDETKKPSPNDVTVCFDSWVAGAYEKKCLII
jgi:hypothetical protein